MKNYALKILIILFLFAAPVFAFSQEKMDTIITVKQEVILAKVVKITDREVEFRKPSHPEGVLFSMDKNRIREIRFSNGSVEFFYPDELEMNAERKIIDKRSALKFHFFSPAFDQLTFSYEHCIKPGMNIEARAGVIDNSLFGFGVTRKRFLIQGGTAGVGVKFLLGKDFFVPGMKYVHPLKGFYFKPEILHTSFVMRDFSFYSPWTSYPVTDLFVHSTALMLNFGTQYVVANVLTVGGNLGFGYAMNRYKYSNPAYSSMIPNRDYPNYHNDYFFSHIFLDRSPIALTGNITIGYILK